MAGAENDGSDQGAPGEGTEKQGRTPWDASYKALFSLRESIIDLLFGYVRGMIAGGEELLAKYDFNRLRFEPVEGRTPGLESRYNDIICCIPLRGKPGTSPDDWLYIAIMLEFQQEIDWFMAHRVRLYADLIYDRVRRRPKARRNDRLPAILPIVLYFGAPSWTAAQTVDALVDPRLAPAAAETASLYSGGSYLLVDIKALVGQDLPLENVVSLMIRTIGISDADAAYEVIVDSLKLLTARATFGDDEPLWLHRLQDIQAEDATPCGLFASTGRAG